MKDLDDDDIIELTDIVDKDSDISTDDVMELTDIAEDENISLDPDIEDELPHDIIEMEVEESETEESETEEFETDEFETDEFETEDVEQTEDDFNKAAIQDLDIDQEQIESVLERVIEKKFYGKIENILFEVMENVIEKQIIEIKESLQKDLDQIDNK